MNQYNVRKQVSVTEHALKRLKERSGKTFENENQWIAFARRARYEGIPVSMMSDEQYKTLIKRCRSHSRSEKIVLHEGLFFIFRGNNHHARTLVTVIKYGGD